MNNKLAMHITLIAASSLTVMAGAAVSAALPAITQEFQSSKYAGLLTRLVITLPAICIAFASPLAGWLVDKVGRRPILVGGLLLYAVGGVAAMWSSSLTVMLVCRAVLGIGVAGIATGVNALVADQFQGEERKAFVSQQSAATALTGVVFVSVGGWLASYGWQFPFAVYALALPVLLMVLRSLNIVPVIPQIKTQNTPAKKIPVTVYPYYILAFFSMIVFYMIPVQMPYLLTGAFGLTSTFAGFAISLAILASALSAGNYARLRKTFSNKTLLLLAAVINGAGLIFIGISTSVFIVVVALFVSGIGNGLVMPIVTNRVMDLAPDALRGRMIGLLYSCLFIGQFLSPVAVLPLSNSLGLQVCFALVGGSVIAAALMAFFLQKQRTEQAWTRAWSGKHFQTLSNCLIRKRWNGIRLFFL